MVLDASEIIQKSIRRYNNAEKQVSVCEWVPDKHAFISKINLFTTYLTVFSKDIKRDVIIPQITSGNCIIYVKEMALLP